MPRVRWTLRTRFFAIVWPLVIAATVGVGWYFGRWTRVEIRRTMNVGDGTGPPAWLADSVNALRRGALDAPRRTAGLADLARTLGGPEAPPLLVVAEYDTLVSSETIDPGWRLQRQPDGSLMYSTRSNSASRERAIAARVRGISLAPLAPGEDSATVYVLPVAGLTRDLDRGEMPGGEDVTRFINAADRAIVWGVVLASLLAGIATWLLARPVVGRATRLAEAARGIRAGDLDSRVPTGPPDELGDVAVAFNEMAEELQKSEVLRQRLIGDVAHELRTPLTNLQGTLEAIQDGVMSPDAETVRSMHEEALLLRQLVQDLQELAMAEAGGLNLECERVDVRAVVDQTVQGVRTNGAGQRVAVTVQSAESSSGALTAWGDRRRIAQILRNLLHNALTHSPDGAEVSVVVTPLASSVQVTVKDEGSGIPIEHQALVWNRFHRVDPARSRDRGGVGLGLAIVKGLVEAQGGTVALESEPGRGTAISFTLPIGRDAPNRT